MKIGNISGSFLGGLFIILSGCGNEPETKFDGKPNILFICVDDLRPQLGCYGYDFMKTPNIDQLAGEGVVFMNHFVQV